VMELKKQYWNLLKKIMIKSPVSILK